MSEPSWVAKKTVLGVLNNSNAQKIKSFSFGGVGFDAKTFPVLAGFIDRDRVKVEYDETLNDTAAYDYKTNSILLGFTWTLDYAKDALIAHECTHAVYDVANNFKMSVAVSESIAYVVQCQYVLVTRGEGKRLGHKDPKRDLVFELAWKIAQKLLAGTAPNASEQAALQAAVSAHPLYAKNAASDSGFDGL